MTKVYIPKGAMSYIKMFKERGWEVVDDMTQADLIQFVGGADVYPGVYGEDPHPRTHFSLETDAKDISVFKYARKNNIPMVGICRGGQFLHAMSGGKLWQDVNHHALAQGHYALCKVTGRTIPVSSTHHQMMRGNAGEVLLTGHNTAHTFKEHVDDGVIVREERGDKDFHDEVEAVWHEKTNSLSYQPHPEMCRKDSECQELYFLYIEKYFGLEA